MVLFATLYTFIFTIQTDYFMAARITKVDWHNIDVFQIPAPYNDKRYNVCSPEGPILNDIRPILTDFGPILTDFALINFCKYLDDYKTLMLIVHM